LATFASASVATKYAVRSVAGRQALAGLQRADDRRRDGPGPTIDSSAAASPRSSRIDGAIRDEVADLGERLARLGLALEDERLRFRVVLEPLPPRAPGRS
jgi:hypothetical protein